MKPVCRFKVLGNAVTNGCSEMAAALVNGIITLMFNWAMLKYVGQNGVAAITIISYVLALAGSLYAGYTYGVAPMISFYYGERNHGKLKRLIRTSLIIIGTIAVATVIVSLIVTEPLVSIFARPGSAVFDLAVQGNRICSLALLFVGFNIFRKRNVHCTFQRNYFSCACLFPYFCIYHDCHADPSRVLRCYWDLAGYPSRRVNGSHLGLLHVF